ncbi:twin-arginine translocase TatA/TatE family subunit [Fictibacillus sp. NPDC058756]|uniref:twin-arginine translocase TatA/TatE family subunit n=1 Tax=Fictibacillus sp. NPDC058756 TaxID=3346625 RepID=UPI0036A09050
MFNQIGLPGIIILITVCIFVFGSKNLPTIGRSVGQSLKEFKNAVSGKPSTAITETEKGTPINSTRRGEENDTSV